MFKNFKKILGDHIITATLTLIGVGLLVASAIVPPPGVIDPSMLAGSTLILGFASLWTFIIESRSGKKVSFNHNGTTITTEE